MNEKPIVITERVDDIPLLLAHLERMGVQRLLDEHFPTQGNWAGLSLGWIAVVWLTHIVSEADHRLHHVQAWSERRLETLHRCTGQPVCPLDFSDDHLAGVLRALSVDTRWDAFEAALSPWLWRVYDLRTERVRLDSTTASGYGPVTPEGLFQWPAADPPGVDSHPCHRLQAAPPLFSDLAGRGLWSNGAAEHGLTVVAAAATLISTAEEHWWEPEVC